MFTIICASHNEDILNKNLLTSPNINDYQLIIQKNYSSVCKAYNDAITKAKENILLFVHHDVYLPKTFFNELTQSINNLNNKNWGVLGVAGCTRARNKYGFVKSGNSIYGKKHELPAVVDTLDELLLIIKKDSNLYFDENIPSAYHMFGADICMQAQEKNMQNFAILAYCEHRHKKMILDSSFYKSADYIKQKWKHKLPIRTTVTLIK